MDYVYIKPIIYRVGTTDFEGSTTSAIAEAGERVSDFRSCLVQTPTAGLRPAGLAAALRAPTQIPNN